MSQCMYVLHVLFMFSSCSLHSSSVFFLSLWLWPVLAAIIKGVRPSFVPESTLAFASSNTAAMSGKPNWAARCKGVACVAGKERPLGQINARHTLPFLNWKRSQDYPKIISGIYKYCESSQLFWWLLSIPTLAALVRYRSCMKNIDQYWLNIALRG